VDRLLLGVDIGTTATKAILADVEGGVRAEASAEARLSSPRPGWAEEDPGQWWRNVLELVPKILRDAGASGDAVAAVGVSGMVPTLVCLDRNGEPLRPSIQQNDARAVAEIEELRRELAGADVLGRTGSDITQQSIGPKVLWLRRNEPGRAYWAGRLDPCEGRQCQQGGSDASSGYTRDRRRTSDRCENRAEHHQDQSGTEQAQLDPAADSGPVVRHLSLRSVRNTGRRRGCPCSETPTRSR
jgi:hypothetical protein